MKCMIKVCLKVIVPFTCDRCKIGSACVVLFIFSKMPILRIDTNLSKEKIPPDFLNTTAEVVAKILDKPVSYVVVHMNAEQQMGWGGTSDICALARLASIGQIGKEVNKQHARALFDHVEKNLGIKSDRMYIEFVNLDKANVGYIGKTFQELL